jgi:hypothetical protein
MATPWAQLAVLGDRPYVATGFDVASLVGWVAMAAGLVGVRAVFESSRGRLGRLGTGLTALGMGLAGVVSLRSAVAFVTAGFRAVPATGEDPAGIVLTYATVLGLACTLVGVGVLGTALLGRDDAPRPVGWLLVAAPAVPFALVVLDAVGALPLPVARLVVTTNAALLPFGVAWLALGSTVRSRARRSDR